MQWVLLVAALASAQPAAAVPLTRSVTLSVYTKKAVPVDDLRPEETGSTRCDTTARPAPARS
jgi:hypothetical protein